MQIIDIFPMKITFWSVLWYIFLCYVIAYIVFHIYIYTNGLEYEIDCKANTNCFKIKKKEEQDNTTGPSVQPP